MKNKYYYQGVLVRTSDREYTHAVISTKKPFSKAMLMSCHSSAELAEKMIRAAISEQESNIRFSQACIKCLESGKTWFMWKSGGRSYPHRMSSDDSIEKCKKWIASYQARIEYIETYWKAVELTKGE